MKHKLLLLLALSFGMASGALAEDVTISNASELMAFASRVNDGETSLNATLTTNINLDGTTWTPIGNSTNKYAGTFDGQGYAITNFSYTSTGNGGLFGYIENATIKNFSIAGSIDVTGGTASGVIGYSKSSTISGIHSSLAITTSAGTAVGHVGGIVGSLNQNDNVSGCSFCGSITANANSHNCFGGIAGYMTNNDKIQNCANYGSITYSKNNCYAGGIEGYINSTSASILNSLSTGVVTYDGEGTATYGGAIVGYLKSTYNSSNFSNNYWLEGSAVKAYGSKTDEANETTAVQLASGEVCYLLNTNGTNWFQTIGTDNNPVPFSTSKRVYKTLADTYINIVGPVQIGDDDDLVNFAVNINHGGTDWDAELTADIDMDGADVSHFPIGTQATGNRYIGTFDGQGHKISNLQLISPSASNYGMFVTGDGVVLKNFWLDNTCAIEGTQYVGLIGRHDAGAATFEGLGNCANVTGSNTRNGGLIGGAWGTVDEVKKTMTIKNCWTKGNVSASGSAGAICGWFNNINVVITNCWTVAEVTGATSDSKYMYDNGAGASFTITNCYSKNGFQPNYTTFTDEQLASGELCYLLNGSTGGGTDWYQDLPSTDAFPYPYSTHGLVYVNGTVCPDTGTPQGTVSYSNTEGTTVGDHVPVDGFCTYCGTLDETYITPNDGYYEIGTPAQLKWFSAWVNSSSDNTTSNAVLTDDINMTSIAATWVPIGDWHTGSVASAYKGHFNGQGHEISNFNVTTSQDYYGIFGVVSAATIENLSINGAVTNDNYNNIGVIGYSRDTSVNINNIQSHLTITNNGNNKNAGGILGAGNEGTTNIDRCAFLGTINAVDKTNAGGIVGYFRNASTAIVNITNCLFDGTITSEISNSYCGGIAGYGGANVSKVEITNCLSLGTLTAPVTGQFFGNIRNAGSSIKNCYYQGDNIIGTGSTALTKVEATDATSAQLASGEVAYLLNGSVGGGTNWYQTLPGDANPTLDSSREKVLYVGAAGYSTFYDADNKWALSSYNNDAKAYIGTINASNNLHLEEIDVIPAGTAVILKGTYYNKVSTTATATTTGNVLKGSNGNVTGDGSTIFALANGENGVGFYPVGDGVTIPAGKAYLVDGSLVKGFTFVFDDDDATAIEKTLSDSPLKGENIYNLAGQRLGNSQFTIHNSQLKRGIYIVNGKKVMK